MSKGFAGIKDIDNDVKISFSRKYLNIKLERLKLSPVIPFEPEAIHITPPQFCPEDKLAVSFVCPICGTKTIHLFNRLDDLFMLVWLDEIRDAAQEVRDIGFEIYLEEKSFCSKCKVQVPEGIVWRITIDTQTFYVKYSGMSDCSLLKHFLLAKNRKDFDRLIDDLPRLEILLGLKHE